MRIGFASQSPYSAVWAITGFGAGEAAAEQGIALDMRTALHPSDQPQIIREIINTGVDALIVAPFGSRGAGEALACARAGGVPVVTVLTELLDYQVDCHITSDNRGGAARVADLVAQRLGGRGRVALLDGPRAYNDATERSAGWRDAFRAYPAIEIAYAAETAGWSPEHGRPLAQAVLAATPDVNAICAPNDSIALATIEALSGAGLAGKVLVTGYDAVPEAYRAILDGSLAATVNPSFRRIGRAAVEAAANLAAGRPQPGVVVTPTALVTRENLLAMTLDAAELLPGVLRDFVDRAEEVNRLREEIIRAQAAMLRELSTPLIPITDDVLVMPLIGAIDTVRAQQVVEALLQGISGSRARYVLIDITGVPVVDTQVANALLRAAQAVQLLGATVILSGIRPEIAQTVVSLGLAMSQLATVGTLQSGVALALRRAARQERR